MMRREWTLGGLLALGVLGMTLARGRPAEDVSRAGLTAMSSEARGAAGGRSPSVPAAGSARELTARIQGTVRDARGAVAGARVLLSVTEPGESLSSLPCPVNARDSLLDCGRPGPLFERVAQRAGEAPVLARTTSGAEGAFSLEAPSTGLVYLWVESPEGVAVRRDVRAGDTVDILLEPGVRMSGLVRDDDKAPVAGALVTAVYQTHSRFFEAVTDATGHYSLGPLPRGPYVVLATHERLLPHRPRKELGLRSSLELNFLLSRPVRLSGVVLRGGAPVEGARVVTSDGLEDTEHHVLTDARGQFSLEGLEPESEYVLSATHAGDQAALSVRKPEDADSARHRGELTLALEPGISLRGGVRTDAGQPVAGALVRVFRRDEEGSFARDVSSRTDAQGQYAVGPLAPGTFQLRVETRDARSPKDQDVVVSKGTGQVDFVCPPSLRVEGVLVDEADQPVVGEPLTLVLPGSSEHAFRSWSVEGGRFLFVVSQPGRYQLALPGQTLQAMSLGQVSAPATGLRMRATRLPTVRGEVVDALGLPLPGVDVRLRPMVERDEEGALGDADTDAEGHFTLAAPGPGRYRLSAAFRRGDGLQMLSREVEVEATGARVTLRLEAGHALSGTVVDTEGEPLEGIGVDVLSQVHPPVSYCGTVASMTRTDAHGRFHFQVVSGESLLVRARGRIELESSSDDADAESVYYHGSRELTPGVTEVRVVVDSD